MRVMQGQGDFRAKAIAGSHTVLIALDCAEDKREGLLGFAFKREIVGAPGGAQWLQAQKVFRSIVPDPRAERDPDDPTQPRRYYTSEHPIQSFLWGDYTAQPDTRYKFTVVPMYGKPGALEPQPAIELEVHTEKEFENGHGVWFNRGAIASQAFARKFGNKAPSQEEIDDPDNEETRWLSRGLLDACLKFIRETPASDGLRVAAYEFTYQPVLKELGRALERGVDVRIVYHDTASAGGSDKQANESAIEQAGLPLDDKRIFYRRTKTKIPHNKFIIRLKDSSDPVSVWTGSTNFTPSGFLGQTNVGHLVEDAATAKGYLAYWELLKGDPDLADARAGALKLTPNPPPLIAKHSIARVFSPRAKSDLLRWYADRIEDGVASVMFTAAFGVAKELVPSIVADSDCLRFILMEKPPTTALEAELRKDRRDLNFSYGDVLGEMYTFKNGKPTARKKIQEFGLDKWFLEEEHYRKANEGFVFFIHTKFLLIDPMSDDPLICSGSANFSSNSLLQNDENMLLIRGDARVADIYLTEFDRIYRHFYFRNVANQIEAKGGDAQGAFLDETGTWTDSYFNPNSFKTRRRELFFADPKKSWVTAAGARTAAAPVKPTGKKPAGKKPAKKTASKKKTAGKKTAGKKGAKKKTAKKKKTARRKGAKRKTAKTAKRKAARKTRGRKTVKKAVGSGKRKAVRR